jgi:hypothetical protein
LKHPRFVRGVTVAVVAVTLAGLAPISAGMAAAPSQTPHAAASTASGWAIPGGFLKGQAAKPRKAAPAPAVTTQSAPKAASVGPGPWLYGVIFGTFFVGMFAFLTIARRERRVSRESHRETMPRPLIVWAGEEVAS